MGAQGHNGLKRQIPKKTAMENLPKTIWHKEARISGVTVVETERIITNKTGSNERSPRL